MSQQLSTKALPQYDWGQEWVKPNGVLPNSIYRVFNKNKKTEKENN